MVGAFAGVSRNNGVRLALTVIIAILIYLGLAFGLQRRILFPRHVIPSTRAVNIDGIEKMWLGPRSDVEAWFLPPLTGGGQAPVLVFTHGNAEIIDYWPEAFREPRKWGMAVLLVEYPGYGRSGGSPTQKTITEVMLSAYDALAERPDIDNERIIAYGRSVGGGAACALAASREVAALILESAFTSVRPFARRMLVPGAFVLDPFDNISVVSEFDGPIMIVHGARDSIIPPAHARKLHTAAPHSELEIVPCGHNDCPQPWPEIYAFLVNNLLITADG